MPGAAPLQVALEERERPHLPAERRREVAKPLAELVLRQLGWPADTDYDRLLCALYYRAFIADRGDAAVANRLE